MKGKCRFFDSSRHAGTREAGFCYFWDSAFPHLKIEMWGTHFRAGSNASGLLLLGAFAHILVDMRPAGVHVFAVLFLNEAETGVAELDDGFVTFLAEAVLHVIGHGVGHHERSA